MFKQVMRLFFTIVWVRIFKHDSLTLCFLFKNVVNPLCAELGGFDVGSSYEIVIISCLAQKMHFLSLVFLYVLPCRRKDHATFQCYEGNKLNSASYFRVIAYDYHVRALKAHNQLLI